MKVCRTINGLLHAIEKDEAAILKIWEKPYRSGETWVLNRGENRYCMISDATYQKVKHHLELQSA